MKTSVLKYTGAGALQRQMSHAKCW